MALSYTLTDLKVLLGAYKTARRKSLRDSPKLEGIDIEGVIARGEAALSDFINYVESLELQGYRVVKADTVASAGSADAERANP